MSMIHTQSAVAVAGAGSELVTVSGQSIFGFDLSGPAFASVIFRTDGTVDESTNAGTSQIDSATDWVRPDPPGDSGDYDIRATQTGSSGPGSRTGTLNTWLSLSSQRTWTMTRVSGFGTSTWTLNIEIRDANSLVVLDSGIYVLSADIII